MLNHTILVIPAEQLRLSPLHALGKGAERFHFCPKEQISKLSIGEENYKEHHGEAQDIFSTSAQRGGQLSHGLVKTDVLKNLKDKEEIAICWRGRLILIRDALVRKTSTLYLDPRKEQVHRSHVVVLCLPEGQELKIGIDTRIFQQFSKQVVHFDGSENVEDNGNNGELQR